MIKRLIQLIKIARKLASSGALDTINQLYKLPLVLKIFFDDILDLYVFCEEHKHICTYMHTCEVRRLLARTVGQRARPAVKLARVHAVPPLIHAAKVAVPRHHQARRRDQQPQNKRDETSPQGKPHGALLTGGTREPVTSKFHTLRPRA